MNSVLVIIALLSILGGAAFGVLLATAILRRKKDIHIAIDIDDEKQDHI